MRRAAPAEPADELLARRVGAGEAWLGDEAERVARLCQAMAGRFARGGRLLAVGAGPVARSDARHVAVEFVHPVIVGKRALPALAVEDEAALALLVEDDDIVMRFAPDAGTTVACGEQEWRFVPPGDDPFVRQELVETLYHVVWELVHVFLDHAAHAVHDTGASSFLYPFLGEQEHDPEAVVADVAASALAKACDTDALRAQTLRDGREALAAAAAELRRTLDAGAQLLALGNGGSATDAMDAVADLRHPPHGWPARPAVDLSEDAGILTAVANDVGVEAMFARQVIAYGRPGDALLAFSTSGTSPNVVAALERARRDGLTTVAFVGYDGGAIARDALADHVVVSRSQHIPRIQEAQASAWHVLRELIEAAPEP